MNRTAIGVVGCGYWGPNLIRNFMEIPDANVLAVADLDRARLREVETRFPGVQLCDDYKDFLGLSLDAVVVATNASSHFEITKYFLQNDLPVLVEKPLTLSSTEADELVALANARNLALMVGHTFEYNPGIQILRDLVAGNELGTIYYVDAVRTNLGPVRSDSNALWDLASHDVSILLYVLGLDPISVGARGGAYLSADRRDVAFVHLIFPDNILAHIHTSWLNPRKVRRITVVGSKKMAVFDDVATTEKLRIYDKGAEVRPYTDTFEDFRVSYRYGDVVIPHIPSEEPLRLECLHFVECVANCREPSSNGEVGRRVVRVLEAAERSLLNGGQQQSLPIMDESRILVSIQNCRVDLLL